MESNARYRFLITGGGGYVGFHIALKLVQFKHQVVLLDLNHPHRTWAKYHIEDSSQHEIIHTSNGSMKFVKGSRLLSSPVFCFTF